MNICRIAFMTASMLLSSMAVADVTPPWFTAEGDGDDGWGLFYPVAGADWVTESAGGSFDIVPDIFWYPIMGPGHRYVVQEIGPMAVLRVHVASFPDHYLNGAPVLELFAGGSSIAGIMIRKTEKMEKVESSLGVLDKTDSPIRWFGIAFDSPRISILGSEDGLHWQTLSESTSSAEGPYHIAFGVSDSAAGEVPVRFENVVLEVPVTVERKSWGQVKSLFYK